MRRLPRSCSASATKAHVRRASTSPFAVLEHRARHLHLRRGVGQVVGERLVDLRSTGLGQLAHAPPDDELREIDGGLGRLQVRGSHGR